MIDLFDQIGKGPRKVLQQEDVTAYNRLQRLLNLYTYGFWVWSHTSTLVPSRKVKRAGRAEEAEVVLKLHRLRHMDLLSRIRRCDRCKKWTFARFPSQRFCGTACRVKAYQSDPNWARKRNKRRVEIYHLLENHPMIKVQKGKRSL